LGLPVASRLGFTRLESIAARIGVSGSGPTAYLWIYLRSVAQPFSQVFPAILVLQVLEISIFLPFILIAASRLVTPVTSDSSQRFSAVVK
jgi:hypothetical protein